MFADGDTRAGLRLYTSPAVPVMPMRAQDVVVSGVANQQIQPTQRRAVSIRSHRAVEDVSTPVHDTPSMTLDDIKAQYLVPKAHYRKKKSHTLRKLDMDAAKRLKRTDETRETDRGDIYALIRTASNPTGTPTTPVIVVTPADEKPWTIHAQRSASRVALFDQRGLRGSENLDRVSRASTSESTLVSSGADRPGSQGWWNLMLSPMLKHGAAMKRRSHTKSRGTPVSFHQRQDGSENSPATLAWNNPSGPPSPEHDTSPETPRRQGLADFRTSVWRSAFVSHIDTEEVDGPRVEAASMLDHDRAIIGPRAATSSGSAAEYFHACAVEAVTGRPYFECIGHSCAQKLPRLVSSVSSEDTVASASAETHGATETGANTKRVPETVVTGVAGDNTSRAEEPVDTRHIRADPGTKDLSRTANVGLTKTCAPKASELQDNADIRVSAALLDLQALASTTTRRIKDDIQPQSSAHDVANHISRPGLSAHPSNNAPIPVQDSPVSAEHTREQHEQTLMALESSSALPADLENGVGINEDVLMDKNTKHHKAVFLSSGRSNVSYPTKRRWLVGVIFVLLTVLIACIVLATQLVRTGDRTPINAQWLNLTGFPPLPTGITTIASPILASSQDQCTRPLPMWSCSTPSDASPFNRSVSSSDAESPTLRMEIRFRNATVSANLTATLDGQRGERTDTDPFTNDLYTPSPTPPNTADQIFLGKTTDNITGPSAGEATPFYITVLPHSPTLPTAYNRTASLARLSRRSFLDSDLLTDAIPSSAPAPDGSAAPADLLPVSPYPYSQPLRLYSRGRMDEHYGFYIYYDKSIFLSGAEVDNNTLVVSGLSKSNNTETIILNSNKSTASVRCTFSQTRFLVKMFTSSLFPGVLLSPDDRSTDTNTGTSRQHYLNNHGSSATTFLRPGSFPYPTTLTLDRHGGDISHKGVYCHNMRSGSVVQTQKAWISEIRGVAGRLINPAPVPGGNSSIDTISTGDRFNKSAGGIDGGTGGCTCSWQNWQ